MPVRWSQRAVFFVGFAFTLLLFDYFTANIISTLQTVKTIESVDEVGKNKTQILDLRSHLCTYTYI